MDLDFQGELSSPFFLFLPCFSCPNFLFYTGYLNGQVDLPFKK